MYHYVREVSRSRYPKIKGLELTDFIKQISFFKKNYNIVSMEDVILSKNKQLSLPHNALLLTFDDGYSEHFSNVYPVLKRFDVKGAFFVPVKPILEHELLDVNKIHYILASIEDIENLLSDLKNDISKYNVEYKLNSFEDYFFEFAVKNRFDSKEVIFVKRMLQHVLPEPLRAVLATKYFEKYVGISESLLSRELYMSPDQLKLLVKDGMHVGCHGYDHYWWDRLESDQLKFEISKSKEFLKLIGCDLNNWTACYPYGGYNKQVISELDQQGCSIAFTTEVGIVNVRKDQNLTYSRFDTNDFPPCSDNYLNIKQLLL
ncbi:polysaccharide deacetylase [Vibrio splendidus]|nr:polysaccharide deacetylase [Vibrio splendidus]